MLKLMQVLEEFVLVSQCCSGQRLIEECERVEGLYAGEFSSKLG